MGTNGVATSIISTLLQKQLLKQSTMGSRASKSPIQWHKPKGWKKRKMQTLFMWIPLVMFILPTSRVSEHASTKLHNSSRPCIMQGICFCVRKSHCWNGPNLGDILGYNNWRRLQYFLQMDWKIDERSFCENYLGIDEFLTNIFSL